ncbi:hypothetical protein DU508_00055 [Pedobacter chinensis]|uniref:Uncharacterized protein n=1 Tax=Pedobacter chinensis TaxID=2282421 RepID=A0A369Q5S5_9SPHI|nr:hypothetical protein [Pedobacter chinensis]RDC58436.1 hypothetical protein DU508_00055 [Pedobacter chinensis]
MKSISTLYYNQNKVIINGYDNIIAPAKIIQCLVIDDRFIILLLDEKGMFSKTNVHCYNIDGLLQWAIGELDFVNARYYTSIYVLSDLFLYAYNICGVEVKLNYQTGEVLRTEHIK